MRPTPTTPAFPARRAARRAALLALLGGALLAPAAAHAQFGGLIKRAAGTAIQGAVSRAAGGRGGAGPDRLPITAARIDAVLAAMQPTMAADARAEAYARRTAPYRRYRECVDSARQALGGPPVDNLDMLPALLKAGAANDTARLKALSATAERRRAAAVRAQETAVGAGCGPAVAAPTEPEPAEPPTPVTPAGMTEHQFDILRERIGLWAAGKGAAAGFDDAERAALAERQAALAPYVAYLKGTARS